VNLPLPPPPGRLPPPPLPSLDDRLPRASRRPLLAAVAVIVILLFAAAVVAPLTSQPRHLSETARQDYSFILKDAAGHPYRWNPCAPIHYVENLADAPDGSAQDLATAIQRVSAATGIAFVDDGASGEIPSLHRDAYQPTRYGARWAPVLIAWVTPGQTDIPFSHASETAAGVASPELPDDQLGKEYVSGWVAINASAPSPTGFASAGDQGPVLQHELGHVMGMGHVKKWGELMQPSGGGVTDYGPGDLAGLKLLGRSQGCLAVPPLPA
jgi:hypothetical protein